MGPARPAALAFDVYGTLIDVSAMARELSALVPDTAALAAGWRRHQLEISWLLSLMDRYVDFETVSRHALDVALDETGVEVDGAAREAAVKALDELPALPDAAPALELLAAADLRLAALSNGSPAMLEAVLERAGLRRWLSDLVSVHEIGVYKPAPAVYRHGASRLGLEPHEVWLVSANPFDCAGGASAGLGVVKVERARSFSYPFAEPPRLTVSTLAELAQALA